MWSLGNEENQNSDGVRFVIKLQDMLNSEETCMDAEQFLRRKGGHRNFLLPDGN